MYFLEIGLFVIGIAFLAIGYRKDNRNLMLTAAIVLFLSGALSSAVEGFIDGYRGEDKI